MDVTLIFVDEELRLAHGTGTNLANAIDVALLSADLGDAQLSAVVPGTLDREGVILWIAALQDVARGQQ